jgi:hypothetical protein
MTRAAHTAALEQFAEELYGALGVSAGLDQDVEHVSLLVDGAPEVVLLAVDADLHLVEVPFIAGSRSAAAQPVGVGLPEFVAPLPDGLVGDDNAAPQHQLLDLAEAEREAEVQPDAMADDLRGVPESLVRYFCAGHDQDPASADHTCSS